jgi:hypothetical protein
VTAAELYGQIRRLCGASVNELPDSELLNYVVPSITWLAEQLKFDIRRDEHVGISADQLEVPLPSDLLWFISVEYNDLLLDPTSAYLLEKEGGNFRTVSSGTPTRYAVRGRNLILNPPADSTAIATDSTLTWTYIGSGGRLPETGIPGLSESDEMLIRYDSAINWLVAHPTDENRLKVGDYQKQVDRRLPEAKRRWERPQQTYYPQLQMNTRSRFGGAR